ncbi:hypothetical protein A2W67_00950 [Candidatus Nomurabacteria bacterium RIFCSPLOWO2_02_40_28]|nr:MAG: hypothetical protein A2W50_01555 [Candidatus Nomurabacteria bacterium RIFCSPHIGHO2_02_40_30]OGI83633.1 MAG: hypothetical protein A3E33_02640 [Candidatus Nomurabacteria bacterium RIFCSPHIGHO2_12_FULL_40_77]OGI96598.1 MAG: hypothetical protein A2W67_00950 [Candidatus Nomurabacteria bacterium RIFCSPLOWO2_02_40_28]OGI99181.1 MAG: hypothetical protein A2W78_02640 [Candidatus Nomurabacteria bacterium RIFCSPLOWO2_12_40_14]HBA45633.1 hypothetical protein [Candidatus Nomurabacteria bacterium]
MNCPICIIQLDGTHLVQIGNTEFHRRCIEDKRREAEAAGKTLQFVWQGEFCTSVQLVREIAPNRFAA